MNNLRWKIYCILTLLSFNLSAFTIIIDPGHGGTDFGARSRPIKLKNGQTVVIREKDIALSISKKIAKYLKKKKYSVFLTRSSDQTVSLEKRARIVDTVKADFFISVHANSSKRYISNGFETFYLDNHIDSAVKRIEEVENKNIDGGVAVVNSILADLVVKKMAPMSKKLATSIHKKLSRNLKIYKMRDRGIKPALFYVLALSKRPAVLLEVGFISNYKELQKIRKNNFQERYSKAVAAGIDLFVKENLISKKNLF